MNSGRAGAPDEPNRPDSGAVIEYDVGSESVAAYLAIPHARHGTGVLVIHDAGGLDEFVRGFCDRLAGSGFVALAPELVAAGDDAVVARTQPPEAAFAPDRVHPLLERTAAELFNRSTVGARIGAVGFGVGGQLALSEAGRNPRIGAVVNFYGARADVAPDFANLEAAVLAIFAERDPLSGEPFARSLEAALRRAGVRASVQTREGVTRGYLDAARPDLYDAVASERDWDAMLAFLRAELQ